MALRRERVENGGVKAQPPSKTLVDKAGATLRGLTLKGGGDPVLARNALDVVTQFRATWATAPQPLAKTSSGLRSMTLRVVGSPVRVSQRLKRIHRIVEKLSRPEHHSMRLSQMEDVGGCRVVVPSLKDLVRLRERILENWHDSLRMEKDYVAHPKEDGYRAIHLIVIRDERLVEIQLRTARQHLWATHVERLEMTRRESLRGGAGERPTVKALRGMGDAFAEADAGRDPALLALLQVWLAQLSTKR